MSILETGAGTGALTKAVLDEYYEIRQYVASDNSLEMLELLRINLGNARKNLEVKQANVMELSELKNAVDPKGVTHVLSLFVNQYFKTPLIPVYNALELLRGSTLRDKPRLIGLGCFGKVNIEELFNNAWTRIEPGNIGYEMFYPDWPRDAAGVKRTLEFMGVQRVYVESYRFPFNFKTVKEFMAFFFEGNHPAIQYLMREVDRQGRVAEFKKTIKMVLKEGKVVKLEDLAAETIIATGHVP